MWMTPIIACTDLAQASLWAHRIPYTRSALNAHRCLETSQMKPKVTRSPKSLRGGGGGEGVGSCCSRI